MERAFASQVALPISALALDSLLLQVPFELLLEVLVNLCARDLLLGVRPVSKYFAQLVAEEGGIWREVIRRRFHSNKFILPVSGKELDWIQYYREKMTFDLTRFAVRVPVWNFLPHPS